MVVDPLPRGGATVCKTAARGFGIRTQERLVKAAVPLVMIVAEIAFLRRCRIEPEHHKHNTPSYDETHGGLLRRPRSQKRETVGSVPPRVWNPPYPRPSLGSTEPTFRTSEEFIQCHEKVPDLRTRGGRIAPDRRFSWHPLPDA